MYSTFLTWRSSLRKSGLTTFKGPIRRRRGIAAPRRSILWTVLCIGCLVGSMAQTLDAAQCTVTAGTGLAGLPNPVLFVGQFPIANDFATIGSTFGNHRARASVSGRGGDLFILYPDGSLCNLTREGGFGEGDVFQGRDSIAVRDPQVHWSGDRALFSMAVGNAEEQFEVTQEYWQLYEVDGLAQGVPLTITKVPHQPEDTNNLTPIYSPDGRIIFSSDRPRDGRRHLYPQHDEYESTATNTGLWSLDPVTGDLSLMNHSPSGVFTPFVDTFGRVVFTRWDHLQRDQQAEADGNPFGNFDWASEEADAATSEPLDIFPEPRLDEPGSTINGHRLNHFFPWMIHPDGREEETLNHIGRHELHNYFNRSFNDDDNLEEFIASVSGRHNPNSILNFFQIAEDPQNPGTYFGVDAPEFQTHASGRIVSLPASPTTPAGQIAVTYVTHPDTELVIPDGDPVPSTHTGHYRDPRVLADGTLLSAHTSEARAAFNEGTRANPDPRYDFRIKVLAPDNGFLAAATPLTPGLVRQLEYYDPDVLVSYNGPLWELQPVEVRARPVPPVLDVPLPGPEAQIFADEGVDPAAFRAELAERQLALVVSRDVTTREVFDVQQPFNLRVPGGTQTVATGGLVYDVQYLQFFQGDQVRGIGGVDSPRPGRRVMARVMHDPAVINPPNDGPAGSVRLAADGSMAALVPAERAMTWQLTDPGGEPVIRERYWLTFQPGEVRVCASCHGLNSVDQVGAAAPTNPPEALRQMLQFWKSLNSVFRDGFESGDATAWSSSTP